jgi:hypothetical protein
MSRSLWFTVGSLLLLAAGCEERNPLYCQGHPQDTVNCPPDAGSGCTQDDQCSGEVCDTISGACVVCTPSKASACTGTTPVCSAMDTCGPCTMHSQCASNVCLPDGSCSDGSNVAYVDGGAGSDGNTCTKDLPCKTLTKGVSAGRAYVKVHGTVVDQVTLNNKNVTLLADPGAKLTPPSPGSLLTIQGTSNVSIFDLEVDGANATGANPAVYMLAGATGNFALTRAKVDNGGGDGILCSASGGTLTVTQSTVSGNTGGGISASGGTLTVTQSTVSGNTGGGIKVDGAAFTITNNFIAGNGGSSASNTVGGANFVTISTSPHQFDFNTVTSNVGALNVNSGLNCGTVTVQATFANNIIYGNLVSGTGKQVGAACVTSYSDIGPDAGAGSGNINADPMFVNASQSDYHIKSTSPCKDAADPSATLNVDFDGDSRPQGTHSDMGADEFK